MNNVASEAAQVWRFPPPVLGGSSAAFSNIEKRAAPFNALPTAVPVAMDLYFLFELLLSSPSWLTNQVFSHTTNPPPREAPSARLLQQQRTNFPLCPRIF